MPESDPRFKFLSGQVAEYPDPKNRIRQYAIRKQKIVIVTADDLNLLESGKLEVETTPDRTGKRVKLGSVSGDKKVRIIRSDCPELEAKEAPARFTVLLEWDETTTEPFPDLELWDNGGSRRITPISQTDNFLLSGDRDTNPPPPRPPIAASEPLNTAESDFKLVSSDDLDNYRQYSGPCTIPTVAVLDTGIKFNLNNLGEPTLPNPYVYRDANNQERRFRLAYQDQPIKDCNAMYDNHLGYCAIRSYGQQEFLTSLSTRLAQLGQARSTPPNASQVRNSPYDDYRLIDRNNRNQLLDARHGTTIAAIIQQNGDNAPILPVKAFDNLGFSTLFDVLNALNYVLHRRDVDDIRVVNMSWIFGRDEPLFRDKIEQLMRAGVFVVAAAGNEKQTADPNLDNIPVYPACYSIDFPNVITVTSVMQVYSSGQSKLHLGHSIAGKLLSDLLQHTGLFSSQNGLAKPQKNGYVAVENYSCRFVNVGVVSTYGHFASPFWNGAPLRGSSFASAFVSGFVVRQLHERPDLLPAGTVSKYTMAEVRQELLSAMSGTDRRLREGYVSGGYYLDGYGAEA
ncbi:S8/S53 family peptidase [Spirosoma taeanense]|uniref:S8/S53 family peptidase n=1 Tax=Spirosoma taeanense TaxID=2735870 RepID=A0A6M5Y6K7_9BACT|nr:S8/S53 family peptidase [Spirosoma taeanense]QJW89549.1 S8/S53 family peptidase [Spirosoma taeanense]